MQPRNHMLDTFRKLSSQVVETVEAALPPSGYLIDDPKGPVPPSVRATWRAVPPALQRIDALIGELGEEILRVSSNNDLTNAAQGARIEGAATVARSAIQAESEKVRSAATSITDTLRKLAFPPRPGIADAAQEAAIAGLKVDFRMLLDPLPSTESCEHLAGLLERALGDDDDLAAWVLASTSWPEDYLKSRGESGEIPGWRATVARTLDVAAPGDLVSVRRVYTRVTNPQTGLPVLHTLLDGFVAQIVSDLVAWRPSSREPMPPTRADHWEAH